MGVLKSLGAASPKKEKVVRPWDLTFHRLAAGGIVTARSVKLLNRLDNPDETDARYASGEPDGARKRAEEEIAPTAVFLWRLCADNQPQGRLVD
jgi:hypothetical protein